METTEQFIVKQPGDTENSVCKHAGMDAVPVTERSNPLSLAIGTASPKDIALTLYACDQEIFTGWDTSAGLQEKRVIDTITKIVTEIAKVLQNPKKGCVVISGCGTSGRLAYLTSRRFNRLLKSQGKEPCFKYIMSGGNDALFSSVELAEDDAREGARRLKEVTAGMAQVVYIGVTCGLSAPFVAGQLDLCLAHLETFTPVLLGFNASHQAGKTNIEHLNKTFHQVVLDMIEAEQDNKAFILNPIVGPEPIAGSTRMKSGTTTKILLDTLALLATSATSNTNYLDLTIPCLTSMFESVCHSVYVQAESLGSIIQMAGESLRCQGHLYYLGCNDLGLMGIIDASECRPTFGASFDDIRGFVSGGIDALDSHPIRTQLSIKDFEREILPKLEAADTVIVFGKSAPMATDPRFLKSPCKKAVVNFITDEEDVCISRDPVRNSCFEVITIIDIRSALAFFESSSRSNGTKTVELEETSILKPRPTEGETRPEEETSAIPPVVQTGETSIELLLVKLAREIAMKWAVNCVSTGAHILLGKVHRNLMVDVRVSNAKLFHRACKIVQEICSLNTAESRVCLLKSIYDTDMLTAAHMSAPVVEHVLAASEINKVVPTAILLSLTGSSVAHARSLLESDSTLSAMLNNLSSHSQHKQS